MRLADRYAQLTGPERRDLAARVGICDKYLYQLAVRFQRRRPSLAVMARLAKADPKLKLKDMVAEFSE